jgi:predicted Fe-S protein YdhL (DUF1289 family)
MAPHRATPCIGICSTTYGDLVCRGCKRFAHEIVDWNAFTPEQRDRVWERLQRLRDACTAECLQVADESAVDARIAALRVPTWAKASSLARAYELLWRERATWEALDAAGIRPTGTVAGRTVVDVRRAIDAEFLRRSKAEYEASFRIPADA